MNTKRFFAVLTMLCAILEAPILTNASQVSGEGIHYCYPPNGVQYASTITSKMRDSSPDWADTEPNPPLSARKAMRLAEATLHATLKEEIDPLLARYLVGVRLVPLDEERKKWCWEVSYEWHRRVGGESGTPYDFCVFVLMNGTVVQPVKVGVNSESKKGAEKTPVKAGKE